ncbi:MAG: PhnD/SsuA/transferrin family substrate-binding protein [Planctomycetes bacterium]|nr:PhnD/SsuA/transferrin family substrate-binding protein [Planctomycetota bacterium]
MRLSTLLLGLLPLALCLAPFVAAQGPAPEVKVIQTGTTKPQPLHLTFGLYQSDKATEMYRTFTPVIEAIQADVERRLGRPTDIEMEIFKTYDAGIEALAKGKVDFVRFGPAPYILAKQKNPDLRLIAMELEDGKKQFNGCIVVARDSSIQELAHLRGKSFAFGDRNSTIGRFLVQEFLLKADIRASDLGRYEYLDRHDKVAAAVLAGDFDAGAVKESNLEGSKGQLRALVTFPNVTKPWVGRSDLDPAVVESLRASLLALKDPSVLKAMKISGFAEASDSDYDAVRRSIRAADAFEPPPSGH